MKFGGRGSVLLLLLAAVVLLRPWESWDELSQAESPQSVSVVVTRVVDGDTIEVQLGTEEEDVRYIGVDTPETVKPGEPVECFGPQASSFNHRLVEGREVRLVFGAERRDTYGRLLAYVYLGDRFVSAELVRRGLARTLTIPPNDRFAGRLKRLEIAAARSGRGLWGAC
jgi:micrococcal nuclease